MGQFSWVCSDTENELICGDIDTYGIHDYTKKAYVPIPKEFGGGSFKVDGNYDGYGDFYDDNGNEVDIYEELAKWNDVAVKGDKQASRAHAIHLYFTPKDDSISQYEKGNYNTEETMKYPLKIVENKCAYEDAQPCRDDPNQGWGWSDSSYDDDEDDYDEEDYYDDDEEEVDEED